MALLKLVYLVTKNIEKSGRVQSKIGVCLFNNYILNLAIEFN